MLKPIKTGFFVWGGILLVVSIVFFGLSSSFSRNYGSDSALAFIIYGVVFLLGAAGLIIPGVLMAISRSKYNKQILNELGDTLAGKCPGCNRELVVKRSQFRPHGRFPEGFVYCRYCKNPISMNCFTPVPSDYTINEGMNNQYQNNYANNAGMNNQYQNNNYANNAGMNNQYQNNNYANNAGMNNQYQNNNYANNAGMNNQYQNNNYANNSGMNNPYQNSYTNNSGTNNPYQNNNPNNFNR